MTIRPDVIRRKLLDITTAVAHLRGWLPVTRERLERDQQLRWAVERGLHVAAEGLFDTGAYILTSEFQEAVDEYAQIAVALQARGVLRDATAKRLKGLAGFRNILVHEYARIDLDRIVVGLERLDDLSAFVEDIEAWLTGAGA